ncbi:hypothetical protein niasHT_017437 [Heterodera trifolii]|uniref:Uncharacterized protein n=1 Tax=Heterodera trifolii TaxID=157864 RepID=A0ABD2L8E9_9BILA
MKWLRNAKARASSEVQFTAEERENAQPKQPIPPPLVPPKPNRQNWPNWWRCKCCRVCTVRASDPKKILSPVDQLLWPCHLPCPRAKKFGGKCRDDDNFWGCEQCKQTLRFAKQDGKGQKAPITHLFCDCGGTRVDHLTFRCAFFADHGDQFNAFTSGETGNGKSTLINEMLFCAKFPTFEDAFRLTTPADFNSDCLAAATYSKSVEQNGKYTGNPVVSVTRRAKTTPRGIGIDNQNKANMFGFFRGFDGVHAIGVVMKDNDNRETKSTSFFLITHSSGSAKVIPVVRKLLEEIEKKNGVKIPLNKSNVFCFDNVAFEALCLIKTKGVEYDDG